jgi:hypothetical protein
MNEHGILDHLRISRSSRHTLTPYCQAVGLQHTLGSSAAWIQDWGIPVVDVILADKILPPHEYLLESLSA